MKMHRAKVKVDQMDANLICSCNHGLINVLLGGTEISNPTPTIGNKWSTYLVLVAHRKELVVATQAAGLLGAWTVRIILKAPVPSLW